MHRLLPALILVALAAGCGREPPEQRLRATIAAMEAAVETNAAGDFVDHVSTDFIGGDGNQDRRQLHALLRAMLLRHRDIAVLLGPLDLTMHGEDRATVAVDALVTGGSGGWLPQSGRRIRIDTTAAGAWRTVTGAASAPAGASRRVSEPPARAPGSDRPRMAGPGSGKGALPRHGRRRSSP